MNFKKLAPLFFATLFSVSLIGCSSSDSGSSVSSGGGTDASLQLSPSIPYGFGTITEGKEAEPLVVTITNNGSSRLDVSSISISDANNFSLDTTLVDSDSCNTASPALPSGDSCTFRVNFQPQAGQTNPITATLTVTSNDKSSPEQLSLTGASEAVNTVNVTINQVDPAATCPSGEVTAYVSVTDQNNFPITGLKLSDFEIFEGSTSIPLTSTIVGDVDEPISIVIALDYSKSIKDDIPEMQQSAIKIIENLKATDEAEIIKFNNKPLIVQPFTNDKAALIAAIDASADIGGTALYDAIILAVTGITVEGIAVGDGLKDRTIKRKAVIVISDGGNSDNLSPTKIDEPISAAKDNDIPVFVVALGSSTAKFLPNLIRIADETSGQLYEAALVQNLDTILQQQLSKVLFVDQYILKYDTVSPAGSGSVNLTVNARTSRLNSSDSRSAIVCP